MTTPEPNAAQLADLHRWLHDPTDTRTRDELRADLRALGGVVRAVDACDVWFCVDPTSDDVRTYEIWHGDLTLIERPRRKLRVGSVWQVGEYGPRYTYLGEDLFGATTRQKVHERSSLSFDTEPEIWREVPVEELEREAEK